MENHSIVCHPPLQMNNLKRTRTSILRSNELVEIQGSYWPRILIVSESMEGRKKSSRKKSCNAKKTMSSSTKVSRRIKKKMELIRQLNKLMPAVYSSSVQRPVSPSFESSPNSLSIISAFDQNRSPCWNTSNQKLKKIRTSSFTGRPVFPHLDNTTKQNRQFSSGLKDPRRRKSLKEEAAPRWWRQEPADIHLTNIETKHKVGRKIPRLHSSYTSYMIPTHIARDEVHKRINERTETYPFSRDRDIDSILDTITITNKQFYNL